MYNHDHPQPIVFSWSGGKDSAMALHKLRGDARYKTVALLTTVSTTYRRISHHGVREELLELQAEAIGLPLDKVYLPSSADRPCTLEEYEAILGTKMCAYRRDGVLTVAHGDIFLADLRARREQNLAKVGMSAIFPLWGNDTRELLRRFTDQGFRAYTTCVERVLGPAFVGRLLDESFLADLPEGVDPCGEYGEYHSFVFDGPIFRHPVPLSLGVVVERDGRFYADLLPDSQTPTGAETPTIR